MSMMSDLDLDIREYGFRPVLFEKKEESAVREQEQTCSDTGVPFLSVKNSREKRSIQYRNEKIIAFVQYIKATSGFDNSFKMIKTPKGRDAEFGFKTLAFFKQNNDEDMALWLNSVGFRNHNYYITKNSYCGNFAKTESMFSLDNIVIDIDNHKNVASEVIDREVERLIYFLDNDYNGRFPHYGIVYTGRGVQLWIGLESIPATEKLRYRYQQLSNELCNIVEQVIKENKISLEVDRAASIRPNGLVKLPETRNMKRKDRKKIIYERFPLERYSYQCLFAEYTDIRLAYGDYAEESAVIKQKKKSVSKTDKLQHRPHTGSDYMPYLLKRIRFIEQLVQTCEGNCEGRRELLLFHFYNSALQIYDKETAVSMVRELNQKFNRPLNDSEIGCAVKSPDKKIYQYSRKKFLEEICLTEEEIQMYSECTHSRQEDREHAKKEKAERNQHIMNLYRQGMTQQKIADEIGCCRNTVAKVLETEKAVRDKKIMKLYSKNMTQQEIADKTGCCKRTVAEVIRKNTKSTKKSDRDAEILRLRSQGITQQEIADMTGCSRRTVINVLAKYQSEKNADTKATETESTKVQEQQEENTDVTPQKKKAPAPKQTVIIIPHIFSYLRIPKKRKTGQFVVHNIHSKSLPIYGSGFL